MIFFTRFIISPCLDYLFIALIGLEFGDAKLILIFANLGLKLQCVCVF